MVTLVRNFIYSVQTTLQDIVPPFRRWPERELVVYTNYAQRAIAKYLPQAGSAADVVRLVPGTKQDLTRVLAANIKFGDGSVSADSYGITFLAFTRNMGADGLTPGRAIRDPVDRYVQDTGNPDWHTAVAVTAIREVVFDKAVPLTVFVSPPVHATTPVWIDMQWMKEPNRVPDGGAPGAEVYAYAGASTAVLGIRDTFVEDAHNYVVAMALLKGSKNVQNLPKSQYHAGQFLASLNLQGTVLTGTNPNLKTLPFVNEIQTGAT